MFKLIGSALLVACGAYIGAKKLLETRESIRLMDRLENSLAVMEAEISLCSRPLPDVFEQLSRETEGELFVALKESCALFSACEAWKQWCKGLEIPVEAKNALYSLGEVLGQYDASRQSAEILMARKHIGRIKEGLKKEEDAKQRNYPILGACFAGIAAMLII